RQRAGEGTPLHLLSEVGLLLTNEEGKELPYRSRLEARLQETVRPAEAGGASTEQLGLAKRQENGAEPLDLRAGLGDASRGRDERGEGTAALAKLRLEAKVDAQGNRTWEKPGLEGLTEKQRDMGMSLVETLQQLLGTLSVPLPAGEVKPGQQWQA